MLKDKDVHYRNMHRQPILVLQTKPVALLLYLRSSWLNLQPQDFLPHTFPRSLIMTKKMTSFYGLTFNPFHPEAPTSAFLLQKKAEQFCRRLEEHLLHEGGFALITGEPGTGKSMTLRALSSVLNQR